MPAGQLTQPEPTVEKSPGKHSKHWERSVLEVEEVPLPEGQEEQEVAPIMLEKVPDGQGRQDEEEEEEEGEGE